MFHPGQRDPSISVLVEYIEFVAYRPNELSIPQHERDLDSQVKKAICEAHPVRLHDLLTPAKFNEG